MVGGTWKRGDWRGGEDDRGHWHDRGYSPDEW